MDNVDVGGFVVDFSRNSHAGSEYVELTMIGHKGKFIR